MLSNSLLHDDLPLWSAPFGLTLLDTILMRTHINVLDIGSGSGFPMLELAERMGQTCKIFGLDPSEDSIEMITAKKEIKEIAFANIVKGVAECIPFPDGFFGLIVSNNGLNNVANQTASLAECYRVADDKAQLVLTMNLPFTMIEFYDVFKETLQLLGLYGEVAKMDQHILDKRKPVDYLKKLILDSGFDIHTINVDGFKMKFSDGAAFLNHHLIRTAFMKSWKEIVPENLTGPVFSSIGQRLDQIAREKGELVMSIPYVCFNCFKNK